MGDAVEDRAAAEKKIFAAYPAAISVLTEMGKPGMGKAPSDVQTIVAALGIVVADAAIRNIDTFTTIGHIVEDTYGNK